MRKKSPLDAVLNVVGSNGVAAVLLFIFLALTFLGTLEQTHVGLFEVQAKYFKSIFHIHYLFGAVPIPLPGVYLVLILLTINLIVGGILRVRKSLKKVGVLIAHTGIILLFLAGFTINLRAKEGTLRLHEGQTSDRFASHYDWEIAITPLVEGEDGPREYVIATDRNKELAAGESVTFHSDALPFDLVVEDYMRNCEPRLVRSPHGGQSAPGTIDGFALKELELNKEASANARGATIVVREKGTGAEHTTLLWGGDEVYTSLDAAPWVVEVGAVRYAIDLRKVRTRMPFAVRLNKFIHIRHPRMEQAKLYASDVTKIEDGVEEDLKIEMNEPLRRLGYTLYQSSYGPDQGRGPVSVFSVVINPADQWPLICTIIIGLGLLIHFVIRLVNFLLADSRRRA